MHETVLDGSGLFNLFRLNETDALRFLTAFYKDLDSQDVCGPMSHVILASNNIKAPSVTPLSLHLPVFIQERGPEAYKFSKIAGTLTPLRVKTEEITSKILS